MNAANLFLIAPPRSGSTQVAGWLASHPDIALARIKEPNFFSCDDFSPAYVASTHLNDVDPAHYVAQRMTSPHQFAVFRQPEHYAYLFEGARTPYRLDASTSYFHSDGAAQRIRAYNPDARVVLLVRHPVKRSISHFGLALRTGRAAGQIERELDDELTGRTPLEGRYLVAPSLYAAALQQWVNAFDSQHLRVLIFEQVIRDPAAALGEICDWLGIAAAGIDLGIKEQNASAAPRFPWLNRTLQRSGIKTWLRSVVPRQIKRRLKRYYFDESRSYQPSAEIRSRLESLFQDDLHATAQLLPQTRDAWL